MNPKDIHPIFKKILTPEEYKKLEQECIRSDEFYLALQVVRNRLFYEQIQKFIN